MIITGKKMRLPPLHLSTVFLGGLVLISLGFASSVGMNPSEALLPLFSVVGGLAVITVVTSRGPRNLL
jgi:hypothetical protein